jgi:hypothetical protein
MADPITALGALAAAAQLSQQCLRLGSLLASIYSSQTYIFPISQHISHLFLLSHHITSNPALQTPAISTLLSSLLVETRSLDESLRQVVATRKDRRTKRWLKGFKIVRMRRVLEERLQNLEKAENLLSIGIEEINA